MPFMVIDERDINLRKCTFPKRLAAIGVNGTFQAVPQPLLNVEALKLYCIKCGSRAENRWLYIGEVI
jgi:hypothetical protein